VNAIKAAASCHRIVGYFRLRIDLDDNIQKSLIVITDFATPTLLIFSIFIDFQAAFTKKGLEDQKNETRMVDTSRSAPEGVI
jgi:hypothetical protein